MFESIEYTHKDGTTERMSKLQSVQAELEPFLDEIARQKADNEERKKPLKIEWKPRIYSKIESVLIKLERPMSNADAINIMDAESLYKCYDMYCELCCWIESKVGISYNKDKPEFCNFAAITTTAFSKFKTEGDPHQREAADDIETRISNSVQIAMENSDIKSTAGQFRQVAKSGIGHSTQVTTAHEPVIAIPVTNNSFRSTAELMSNLAVLPEPQKQLPNRKGKK